MARDATSISVAVVKVPGQKEVEGKSKNLDKSLY